MADIRNFIKSHLLSPLKEYNTIIQDTMIEIIADRLSELYDYTVAFPEILSPNSSRLDILKTIADQFLFTIREEADLQEQIDILENILYVYRRRGSIDTIENMWKYYGGDLPKDVKVLIPSYDIFRYSISALSGTHKFSNDSSITEMPGEYRSGVYEIRLTNNTYPIPDLRDFMLKELVAAGNRVYFTNAVHADLVTGEDVNPYKILVTEETFIQSQLEVLKTHVGFSWSGMNDLSGKEESVWSGKPDIYVSLVHMKEMSKIDLNDYRVYQDLGFYIESHRSSQVIYRISATPMTELILNTFLHCTSESSSLSIVRYLYNSSGEIITSDYPGFFILGETLLGKEVV